MLEISTTIRVGDDFIDLYDYRGDLLASRYVDGCILISIDGDYVLPYKYWDNIIFLWESVIDSVANSMLENVSSIQFPDQPLKFTLLPIKESKVELLIDDESVAIVDRKDLLVNIFQEGLKFFSYLSSLQLNHGRDYGEYVTMIKKLVSKI